MNISILYFLYTLTASHRLLTDLAIFFSEYLVYILPISLVGYIFLTEKEPFKKSVYSTLTVLVAVGLVDVLLKGAFAEVRPFITLHYTPLISESGFSFPSGHATLAGALCGATYFSISKHPWFTWVVSILCLGIALSRVMLGVHYPTDILGGLIFGFLVAWIGHYFLYVHKKSV